MSRYQEDVRPSESLTPTNAALLLIDHQAGLMQWIRDRIPEEFMNNTSGDAKTAKHFKLPVCH